MQNRNMRETWCKDATPFCDVLHGLTVREGNCVQQHVLGVGYVYRCHCHNRGGGGGAVQAPARCVVAHKAATGEAYHCVAVVDLCTYCFPHFLVLCDCISVFFSQAVLCGCCQQALWSWYWKQILGMRNPQLLQSHRRVFGYVVNEWLCNRETLSGSAMVKQQLNCAAWCSTHTTTHIYTQYTC